MLDPLSTYSVKQWSDMARTMTNNNEVIKIIDKALWYVGIITKNNIEDRVIPLYNDSKYWLPPFSKYKIILAYISSVNNDTKPHYCAISQLYSVAASENDVIGDDGFNMSVQHLVNLRSSLTNRSTGAGIA
jgi:hypothetical protein